MKNEINRLLRSKFCFFFREVWKNLKLFEITQKLEIAKEVFQKIQTEKKKSQKIEVKNTKSNKSHKKIQLEF